MILRKCFNCQYNYVSKNWDDIKCPYCGAYNVYRKGVRNMDKPVIFASDKGTRVTGSKEAIEKEYINIVRTIILSTALSPAEVADATMEGIRQGEEDNDPDWVL